MSTYVFVHGAWHGGWCWYRLIPLLERQGHKVVTPDMPGHGIDRSIPLAAGTLSAYTDHVKQIVKQQEEPVILVGHSLGGQVITQVADEVPDAIQKLVYLTAYLLPPGVSTSAIRKATEQHTRSGAPSPSLYLYDAVTGLSSIQPDLIRNLFYADCSESDIALARTLLTAEPRILFIQGVAWGENFTRVPRFFIECLNDQAIPLHIQRQMYTALPCERVFTLPTGHSSFFSAPESLADILASIAS